LFWPVSVFCIVWPTIDWQTWLAVAEPGVSAGPLLLLATAAMMTIRMTLTSDYDT
jgi:hypothetical protein